MFHSATVIGNLGQDPEIRQTNGGLMATFSIAESETWKDANGNRQERTQWHNVVCFQKGDRGLVSSVIQPYLHKGDRVHVVGKYRSNKKDDKTYWNLVLQGLGATLTLMGGSKGGGDNGESRASNRNSAADSPSHDDGYMDDEIPF